MPLRPDEPPPSRIKIISDGTPLGTKLVDPETGETLDALMKCLVSVSWQVDVDGLAAVSLGFQGLPVEVVGRVAVNKPLPR